MKKKAFLTIAMLIICSTIAVFAYNEIQKRIPCSVCGGSGTVEKLFVCDRCSGIGIIRNWRGERVQCDAPGCNGGRVWRKQVCDNCDGVGFFVEIPVTPAPSY